MGKKLEIDLAKISSLFTLGGGVLMIVIGLYILIESIFGAVFLTGESAFSGSVMIVCGFVAFVGWNKVGMEAGLKAALIWPIVLIIVGGVGGGSGGVLAIIGGLLGIAAEASKEHDP